MLINVAARAKEKFGITLSLGGGFIPKMANRPFRLDIIPPTLLLLEIVDVVEGTEGQLVAKGAVLTLLALGFAVWTKLLIAPGVGFLWGKRIKTRVPKW